MKYADDYSGFGDDVMYRMCRDKPLHDDINVISSKLWIIGRTYSAAIERKAGKDFKINSASARIKESDIDTYISKLKAIQRLTQENLDTLLTSHKYLIDVLKPSTSVEKRSLVSKYLHFHAPLAVFVYDSRANIEIKRILKPLKQRFKLRRTYDDEYEAFALKCMYFRDFIYENELGAMASPRRIDMRLCGYALNP